MEECYKTLDKWYSCYLKLEKKVLIDDDDLLPLYDDLTPQDIYLYFINYLIKQSLETKGQRKFYSRM